MGTWTGLIWLRTGTSDGLLWTRWWTFEFHKMWEIFLTTCGTISFCRSTPFRAVSQSVSTDRWSTEMCLVSLRRQLAAVGLNVQRPALPSTRSWNLFTNLCKARLHAFRKSVFTVPLKGKCGQTGECLWFPVANGATTNKWVAPTVTKNQPQLRHTNFDGALVTALRYKQEGRGFDCPWGNWDFLSTQSFRPHYGPGSTQLTRDICWKAQGWQPCLI